VGLALLLPSLAHAEAAGSDFRFVIKGGEVYDTRTNLTWQRCSVGLHWTKRGGCMGVAKKEFTFADAQQQATKNWRVPGKDELESLIADKRKGTRIEVEAFPDMEEGTWYWTSEMFTNKLGWDVHFDDGEAYETYLSDERMVRLVRSGK
jgi:hypothetical protein